MASWLFSVSSFRNENQNDQTKSEQKITLSFSLPENRIKRMQKHIKMRPIKPKSTQ